MVNQQMGIISFWKVSVSTYEELLQMSVALGPAIRYVEMCPTGCSVDGERQSFSTASVFRQMEAI